MTIAGVLRSEEEELVNSQMDASIVATRGTDGKVVDLLLIQATSTSLDITTTVHVIRYVTSLSFSHDADDYIATMASSKVKLVYYSLATMLYLYSTATL